MAEQKYLTEVALSFYPTRTILFLPSELPSMLKDIEEKKRLAKCHIYFILKRPRITLVPNSLIMQGIYLKGQLCFHEKGQRIAVNFKVRVDKSISFKMSDYPHNKIITTRHDGQEEPIAISIWAQTLFKKYHPRLSLEVIYIGQAFGKDGQRTAIDRLADHATLQKVQSDILTNDPDSELFLLLFEFDAPIYISKIDGAGNPRITGDENRIHHQKIMRELITEANRITIIEAALIRYFQPQYNIIYKDKFPSTNIESLKKCYKLDFSALMVEVSTKDIGLKIFSKNTIARYHHRAKYDLHSETDRRSFFCL